MPEWKFERDAIARFRFVRCSFDAGSGEARLVYAFDEGPELVETVRFAGAPFDLAAPRLAAVERALRLLHLIAGVSYYKAAVPAHVVVEGEGLDPRTEALLVEVYESGLGEFAYRNGLSLRGNLRFEHEGGAAAASATALGLSARPLVAIGGGKDSLVSIESLRRAGSGPSVAWIGSSQLIAACAARTGLPMLNIQRALAPELFEFNQQGAYNGHIPVTAVNSAILVLAALLHDHDQVVFSNERSASYGSLIPGTGEVNHQWSKGWDFEQRFAALVKATLAPDLAYYSLLRPLSELAVARQFARSDRYDAHFSSCNRNFHILGPRPASRWCGQCPKCHFVFLALAPFMPKPRLVAIFGANLLDEPRLAPGFDALIEYRDHKPFECVGEGQESRAAFAALAASPAWREDALVQRFAREIQPQLGEQPGLASLLPAADTHNIPEAVWAKVSEDFRA